MRGGLKLCQLFTKEKLSFFFSYSFNESNRLREKRSQENLDKEKKKIKNFFTKKDD